jgi:hypothetical protein
MSTQSTPTVEVEVEVESLSPYQAAKVVNAILLEKGIEKVLPPQMFYNYTTSRIRQGKSPLIPTTEVNGHTQITLKGLTEWTEKYVAKHSA